MEKVANVFTAPAKHWVGNGFHVASMFSYNDKDKKSRSISFNGLQRTQIFPRWSSR